MIVAICHDHLIVSRGHLCLNRVVGELIAVHLALVNVEVSEIPIVVNRFIRMVDVCLRVKYELCLLGVELNSEKWILLALHRCDEGATFVVVADSDGSEYFGETSVGQEPVGCHSKVMVVVGQCFFCEDLTLAA